MASRIATELGTFERNSTLIDRLFALFWKVRLTDGDLDAWYRRSAPSFADSLETSMAVLEHKLEWTDLHEEFKSLVERRLERHCLEVEGFATLGDALAAVEEEERASANGNEMAKRLTLLLKSASDYTEFVRMMRAKARRRESQLRRARSRAAAAAKAGEAAETPAASKRSEEASSKIDGGGSGGGGGAAASSKRDDDAPSSKTGEEEGTSSKAADAGDAAEDDDAPTAASFFANEDGQW